MPAQPAEHHGKHHGLAGFFHHLPAWVWAIAGLAAVAGIWYLYKNWSSSQVPSTLTTSPDSGTAAGLGYIAPYSGNVGGSLPAGVGGSPPATAPPAPAQGGGTTSLPSITVIVPPAPTAPLSSASARSGLVQFSPKSAGQALADLRALSTEYFAASSASQRDALHAQAQRIRAQYPHVGPAGGFTRSQLGIGAPAARSTARATPAARPAAPAPKTARTKRNQPGRAS